LLCRKKGRASRRKGLDNERALVRYLQGRGITAEKISRTGYTGSDLSPVLLGIERRVECKVRSHGFTQLYDWLANSDLLIIRADRREPLVCLPLWLAAEVAAVAEQKDINEASSLSSRKEKDASLMTSTVKQAPC
jgi:hypothetical protein